MATARLAIIATITCSLFCFEVTFAETAAVFTLASGVTVRIVEEPVTASRQSQCRIGGRIVPRAEGAPLPKTYVKSITVSFQGRSYELDASCMYNAWGKRPLEVPGVIRYFGGKCFDARNCQFRGLFADASEAFVAEWRVVNGTPIRTVLSGSIDIVNLFSQHIDPPEFD
jgi:hypothetical protein